MGLLPAAHVNVTVTLVLFQPLALGAGEAVATICGSVVTVKFTGLLEIVPTLTITGPVVAPLGTGTVMPVEVYEVGEAGVPLKVTVPLLPKFLPAIVTDVPTGPVAGVRLVILGPEPPVTQKVTGITVGEPVRPDEVTVMWPV